jgi:hypothetical protein
MKALYNGSGTGASIGRLALWAGRPVTWLVGSLAVSVATGSWLAAGSTSEGLFATLSTSAATTAFAAAFAGFKRLPCGAFAQFGR